MPFGWSCRNACTMVESLTTWNNWSRRSCWSGAHCHRDSLMAVSTSGGVAFRLSYRRMVDILNKHSTSCRHLYSITLLFVAYVIRDELLAGVQHMIFFKVVCLRQSCWSYVAPSSMLSVNYKKFSWNLHHTTSCCMQFTFAKNHWILPTHSNVTSKIVSWLYFSWTTL